MRRIKRWMNEHSLSLAEAKTQIVVFTRKRIQTSVTLRVGETDIQTASSVKYLGVILDTKLSYWPHIQRAADKAAEATKALSRLMANTNGPKCSKRRLLMSVMTSILLYGAEIWAKALEIEKYRKRMAAVQRRGALRVSCAYRTVSEAAVLVIVGTPPIDLLAQERQDIWRNQIVNDRGEAKKVARQVLLEKWQQRWEDGNYGKWTKRLIPRLDTWLNREHGEVTYYLTQLLRGHGCFRKYLHRMQKVSSPKCLYCNNDDDAQHTFFMCERW